MKEIKEKNFENNLKTMQKVKFKFHLFLKIK